MEMLHTAEEIVRLSNAAHLAEGMLLIILAGVLAAQAFGYLHKSWQRYLLPAIGLLASLTLAGFLFVDHAGELGKAWQAITTDMQQKQHLYMGSLIGIGSIAEFIAIKRNKKLLHFVFPAAVAVIGILFLVHPQHGSSEVAQRALLIHRIVGSALIIGALAQAVSVLRAKSKKVLLLITALAFVVSGILFISYREPLMDMDHSNMTSTQSQSTYSLNLMSGKSYLATKPVMLHYAIQDQTGKVLKNFDVVHEKKMHLIVVRKDRTNFQHVHPTLDEATGMFMIEPFTFPTDGDYRVYADFTPSSAQKDEMGMKLPSTPYQDVQVGDLTKYMPVPLNEDRLTSNVNGFETSIFFPPPDDSPGVADTNFYAGQESNIAISINKDGQPFKNLQNYLGALGHMVVLGPTLEFIHGHPQTVDVNTQGGLIVFTVKFPDPGQYKLYLQTQADNQVNTTDYTVTAKANPSSQGSQSMPGMNH